MTLDDVKKVRWTLEQLRPISRKLNAIGVRGCNGRDERQEARDYKAEQRLRGEAHDLAQGIGLLFYHQTDPRGCAVYLIDKSMDDSTYNQGIAI